VAINGPGPKFAIVGVRRVSKDPMKTDPPKTIFPPNRCSKNPPMICVVQYPLKNAAKIHPRVEASHSNVRALFDEPG